ncbi:type II toxin-antitoxin system RelE/ParE family toxin [Rhizobium jaguaris]|uniref:Type II toxin-antitoxin system RelE/ParE family toxin n=1 Tax=Rhizobium jaguaris TaxID=1312183 RepID=A0A387FGY9_9HYPH|nr:type II toxin-antitoxin system RelE/ParE family toxin [Rhizobium jaguaris]AYG57623.1 type II toxin-antitoxin system RelE/ParE family toxin [Rhizobium jaguaris]
MPRLIWSPRATRDVQRLYRFLTPANPDAATRAVRTIRSSVRILSHQPQLGRFIEDMSAEFREWIIDFGRDGYVVRYHYDGDAVVILAIRHGREDGYK